MHSKERPKQFLEIYNKPIIVHTIEYFQNCDLIDVYKRQVEKYKLVTSIRGNSMENRISIESPIGKALRGHRVGDRVEVKVNDDYSYYLIIKSIDKTGSELSLIHI